MAGPLIPIIVSVGGALIRTTAKQAPAILRRFKGARRVSDPTKSQINAAERLTKNYTNFSKRHQNILGKADSANPSLVQRITGTGKTKTQQQMQNVTRSQGEAKRSRTRNRIVGGAIGAAGAGGVGAAKLNKLKSDLKKAKTAENKAKLRAQIETVMRQLQKAESMPKIKPRVRPTQ